MLRGLALCGTMIQQAVLAAAALCVMVFSVLGFGLYMVPGTLLAFRGLADRSRRLSRDWSGVDIPVPYRRPPETNDGSMSWSKRSGWLLTDPATWRDLAWSILNPAVGWLITLAPAALVVSGLFGVVMPAVWKPIVDAGGNNWYFMIHVTDQRTAWLSVPLGAVVVTLGLLVAPALLRHYGRFAHSLLAPTAQARLKLRVRHLANSRSDVVDSRSAEISRIERNLHDGAQARLVGMGMTLSAANRLLDDNPAAARAMITEAQQASAMALAELRDLIRGIHPPVLADRGLADAIRALALDSPLTVKVVTEMSGRVETPVEAAAYFAISELLANVVKHAHAEDIEIDLRYHDGFLRIGVTDNGQGGADAAGGTGLNGIERRLAAFDGVLALNSPPGGPTTVTMEIPCVLSTPRGPSS